MRRASLAVAVLAVLVLFPTSTMAVTPSLAGPVFLPGDDDLAPAASNQETPAIAAGGTGFLVVWADSRTNFVSLPPFAEEQGARDIYAARLDPAGNLIDTVPIVVNQDFGYQRNPRVSWNGENWLVVWENQTPTQFYYASGIFAARVAPDGTVLDDPPMEVHSYTNSSTSSFDVTANGSTWLVVAQGTSSGEGGILGVRVSGTGAILDSPPVVLEAATYYLYFNIGVHQARGEYLLTFTGSGTPEARRFQADLTPIGTGFQPPGVALGSSGSDYYVTWVDSGTTLGSPMAPDGTLLLPSGSPIVSGTVYDLDVGWDGTSWWAGWHDPVAGVRRTRISAGGTVLDPGGVAVVPTVENVQALRVAGGLAGGVELVWQDFRNGGFGPFDVRGVHVDATGSAGTDLPLSMGAPAQLQSDIAPGPAGEFLAVHLSLVSGQSRILARRVSGAGIALDPAPVELASGQSLSRPAVDWDGSRYLVVWSDDSGIVGKRVAADGTVVDPVPLPIMDGTGPDVAGMDGVFLVVGTQPTISVHFYHPFSMRVDGASGTVLDPAPVLLGQYFARYPRVVRFGNRWLAAWQRNISHDNPQAELKLAFIDSDGTSPGEISTFLGSGYTPDIAVSGGIGLIAYRTGSSGAADQDIRALRILPDGTFPDGTAGIPVSDSPDRQFSPRAAWDGTNFCVVWEDKRNAVTFFDERTDVYAARVTDTGQLLDLDGFPVTDSPLPETGPTIASAGGSTLILAALFRDLAPHAAYRLGVFRAAGTATDPPQAAFSAAPTAGCAPLSVSFTDASSGDITSWSWSFGDGGTSNEQSPVHVYADPGVFTASLTVSGPTGSSAFVEQDLVSVPEPISAGFTADGTAGCAPLAVSFTDLSTGGPTAWLWDFGDGGTSTEANPAHVYQAPGAYSVTLTATGSCGPDLAVRTDYITVGDACPLIALATADQPVAGTISGDYTATHSADYVFQTVTEIESGGKPSSRYTYLEHRWPFDVPAGGSVTFFLDAYRGSTGDGDGFAFEYSTDGTTFLPLAVLSTPGFAQLSIPLPAGPSGPVTVRVVDTDRTPGNLSLDTVNIDHMRFEVAVGGTPPPPDEIHVADLKVIRVAANGKNVRGRATVKIEDAGGAPVAGATVSGRFSGPTSGAAAGVTGTDGSVALLSAKARTAAEAWCFTVEEVSKPGAVHDASQDVATTACEIGAASVDTGVRVRLLGTDAKQENGPRIRFVLSGASEVALSIFDVRGRLVHAAPIVTLPAGEHNLTWEHPRGSGVYFYRLRAAESTVTGRLVVVH